MRREAWGPKDKSTFANFLILHQRHIRTRAQTALPFTFEACSCVNSTNVQLGEFATEIYQRLAAIQLDLFNFGNEDRVISGLD